MESKKLFRWIIRMPEFEDFPSSLVKSILSVTGFDIRIEAHQAEGGPYMYQFLKDGNEIVMDFLDRNGRVYESLPITYNNVHWLPLDFDYGEKGNATGLVDLTGVNYGVPKFFRE